MSPERIKPKTIIDIPLSVARFALHRARGGAWADTADQIVAARISYYSTDNVLPFPKTLKLRDPPELGWSYEPDDAS